MSDDKLGDLSENSYVDDDDLEGGDNKETVYKWEDEVMMVEIKVDWEAYEKMVVECVRDYFSSIRKNP